MATAVDAVQKLLVSSSGLFFPPVGATHSHMLDAYAVPLRHAEPPTVIRLATVLCLKIAVQATTPAVTFIRGSNQSSAYLQPPTARCMWVPSNRIPPTNTGIP